MQPLSGILLRDQQDVLPVSVTHCQAAKHCQAVRQAPPLRAYEGRRCCLIEQGLLHKKAAQMRGSVVIDHP